MWTAKPTLCGSEKEEETTVNVRIDDESILDDYSSWTELAEIFHPDTAMERWDDAGIAYCGAYMATLICDDLQIEAIVAWQEQKVAVCEDVSPDAQQMFEQHGWKLVHLQTDPAELGNLLKGE